MAKTIEEYKSEYQQAKEKYIKYSDDNVQYIFYNQMQTIINIVSMKFHMTIEDAIEYLD